MKQNSHLRKKERYNHVFLKLKYQDQDEWFWAKVFDWNSIGFKFYSSCEFKTKQNLCFKKGVTTFSGRVAWEKHYADEKTLIEMALNFHILRRFKEHFLRSTIDVIGEVTELIRQKDVVEKKLDFMDQHLGGRISAEEIKRVINANQWDKIGQFGIEIDDDSWTSIAEEATKRAIPLREFDKRKENFLGLF